jgi:hypothetical protein
MLGPPRATRHRSPGDTREREVLVLLAEAARTRRGAPDRRLRQSVLKHVTWILSKLGLPAEPGEHRRVSAVLAYLDDARTTATAA